MNRSYITFEHVWKTYLTGGARVDALRDVSFGVEKGEFTVILGASGAGKTTLLNMLGGMDRITEGKIWLDGREISAMNEKEMVQYRRYDVGFVFQFYNLIPNLTTLENVEMAAMLCPDPVPADRALELERRDNFPAQLSGGEQQRVAIARALAKNPKLLLCDEPTGALDYRTGKAVLQMLYDLGRKDGTTTLVITHNQAIARAADRVIRIRSGQIESDERNQDPVPVEKIEW